MLIVMKLFVSVGTRPNQFDRLARAADELALKKGFEVFVQSGNSTYVPKNADHSKFLGHEETLQKMKWCDVAVVHAGAGTLIELLALRKPVVLFPRLEKYGEHTNDHQVELCKAIKAKYGAEYTTDEGKLYELILKAAKRRLLRHERSPLGKEIRAKISGYEKTL
jgi:UDP-N-acetylglucosamine transferase subunit ALG13